MHSKLRFDRAIRSEFISIRTKSALRPPNFETNSKKGNLVKSPDGIPVIKSKNERQQLPRIQIATTFADLKKAIQDSKDCSDHAFIIACLLSLVRLCCSDLAESEAYQAIKLKKNAGKVSNGNIVPLKYSEYNAVPPSNSFNFDSSEKDIMAVGLILANATQTVLEDMDTTRASKVFWSFSLLSIRYPSLRAGVQSLVERSLQKALLQVDELSVRSMSMLLHACLLSGRLLMDEDLWKLAGFAGVRIHRSGFRRPAFLLWCLAELQYKPKQAWLDRFCAYMLPSLPSFAPKDFTQTAWALNKFQIHPDPRWMDTFWSASEHKLQLFSSQEAAQTTWSLANLDIIPPDSWLLKLLTITEDKLGPMDPVSFTSFLYSLARWKLLRKSSPNLPNTALKKPSKLMKSETSWVERATKMACIYVGVLTPLQLADVLRSLSMLGVRPDQGWFEQVEPFAQVALRQMSSSRKAKLTKSLSILRNE